jgi:hypothetical protein
MGWERGGGMGKRRWDGKEGVDERGGGGQDEGERGEKGEGGEGSGDGGAGAGKGVSK